MKNFVLGFISAFVALFVGGYLFIALGGLPMGMKSGPLPFEERIANLALGAALKKKQARRVQFPPTTNT